MQPDFEKLGGLLPVVVQDAQTQKVLMLGFMNQAAYLKTLDEKVVTFFSRTKNRLWTKGETSGNFLHVVSHKLDCDNDTLLIQANPTGGVCHTGSDTCFDEPNQDSSAELAFLKRLENLIQERKKEIDNPEATSYTVSLFRKGIPKIAQKVGEEAVESVIEAVKGDKLRFEEESADLLYHFLVLLAAQDLTLADIVSVLEKRNR
ncbi:bifunctional phosphoribosyl-AMP cyclohydrolase/phosphoribosyl-ATP diphosphatase HisIE [Hugenholtzia roseola]|uniref:bifunctional phosphoribosyl-AMP cyclohydrolase/phosphoribosyl-ATP diphosphatase HisIE n=1 Tax=Hugenholtzia roseola TaxID=1002 RepID=UPI0003F56326|nr:bifunctional phosphoribosyl-AMP cyclohydrolase/phosphoribosyl-ATP diphosphatase HisIE [Hugenholtzia roseola]